MRCEGFLSKDYLRARRGLDCDGRCRRIADFEINGENLCTEHASLRAMTKILDLGMAVRLTRIPAELEYRHSQSPKESASE